MIEQVVVVTGLQPLPDYLLLVENFLPNVQVLQRQICAGSFETLGKASSLILMVCGLHFVDMKREKVTRTRYAFTRASRVEWFSRWR